MKSMKTFIKVILIAGAFVAMILLKLELAAHNSKSEMVQQESFVSVQQALADGGGGGSGAGGDGGGGEGGGSDGGN